MHSQHSLTIPQLYSLTNHTDQQGIEGYYVDKKYFDSQRQIKQREFLKVKKGQKDRRHVIKRGNFLDDETKMHKIVPGPGTYPISAEWPIKSRLKIKYPDKATYIDQVMQREKKEKKPAPGQYNVTKTIKQLDTERKIMSSKKVHYQNRITYLDQIQYQSNLLPGAGNYNPRQRAKTEYSQLKTKPEEWRKKHETLEKKKLPKLPDMRTYQPTPISYSLFDQMRKIKPNKNLLGKVDRFKTEPSGSGLNPAKYNVIQEWRGKDNKKTNRHGIEVLSTKSVHKNVYYH